MLIHLFWVGFNDASSVMSCSVSVGPLCPLCTALFCTCCHWETVFLCIYPPGKKLHFCFYFPSAQHRAWCRRGSGVCWQWNSLLSSLCKSRKKEIKFLLCLAEKNMWISFHFFPSPLSFQSPPLSNTFFFFWLMFNHHISSFSLSLKMTR